MRVTLSKNDHSQIYVSKDINKVLKLPKRSTKVQGIANTRTVLLMQAGITAEDALKSLEVIKQHLQLEVEEESKKN